MNGPAEVSNTACNVAGSSCGTTSISSISKRFIGDELRRFETPILICGARGGHGFPTEAQRLFHYGRACGRSRGELSAKNAQLKSLPAIWTHAGARRRRTSSGFHPGCGREFRLFAELRQTNRAAP